MWPRDTKSQPRAVDLRADILFFLSFFFLLYYPWLGWSFGCSVDSEVVSERNGDDIDG